jgi:2-C-methyl-D-erythritol 2,4-cyclodiphosphate synthase
MTEFRIGHGYDIHRLVPGRNLILGGERIEFHLGLDGHSDADVIIHALMDSLLGATALGDIGIHFPNTDPAWKDANSMELLRKIGEIIKRKSYTIGNIDITIIAERPKLSPHIPQMVANISQALGIDKSSISIKATTNEGVGFIGRGEGIAAFSVALLHK